MHFRAGIEATVGVAGGWGRVMAVVTIRTALVFETDNEEGPSVRLSREIREKHGMLREVVVLELVSFFAPPLPYPTVTADPEQMLALVAMLNQTKGTLKFGELLQDEVKLEMKPSSELLKTERAWCLTFRSTEEESKSGGLELTSGELTTLASLIEIVASMPRVAGRRRSVRLEVDSIQMRFIRFPGNQVILFFEGQHTEQEDRQFVRLEGTPESLRTLQCGLSQVRHRLLEELVVFFEKDRVRVRASNDDLNALSLFTEHGTFTFTSGGSILMINALGTLLGDS